MWRFLALCYLGSVECVGPTSICFAEQLNVDQQKSFSIIYDQVFMERNILSSGSFETGRNCRIFYLETNFSHPFHLKEKS